MIYDLQARKPKDRSVWCRIWLSWLKIQFCLVDWYQSDNKQSHINYLIYKKRELLMLYVEKC